MNSAWEQRLAVVGSAASIAGASALFIDQQVIKIGVTDVLLTTVPVPALLVAIASLAVVGALVVGRRNVRIVFDAGLRHIQPHLVTSADRSSATTFPSTFLKSATGGVSIWVLIPKLGEGIRMLANNRYIFAHATHSEPYKNVFALCLGPANPNASSLGEARWKLWLADSKGRRRRFQSPDPEELQPGWHHFLVRWNHTLPRLEALIDGTVIIREDDYLAFWPQSFTQHIHLGAWPIREWGVHFAETCFWRSQVLSVFPDDDWIQQERQINPPA